MERENYFRYVGLITLTIVLLTISAISILKTAESVSNNIRLPNSLSVYDDSCYVYGDNTEYALICLNYMNGTYKPIEVE